MKLVKEKTTTTTIKRDSNGNVLEETTTINEKEYQYSNYDYNDYWKFMKDFTHTHPNTDMITSSGDIYVKG